MAELWQALIDNSGAVIAVFTVVLALTTIIYVVVTAKLLKQSRNALLADIALRVIRAFRSDLRGMKKEQIKGEAAFIRAWLEGCHKAFMGIDKKLGIDIKKLFDIFLETTLNEFFEAGENMGEEWKKAEKKVEKLRDLIEKEKEKEDLERPKNHKKKKL